MLPRVRIAGGQPDLIVLLVLAWAILDREQEGLVWGFVGGFVLDLFSGVPLGVSSLALVPVAFVVSLAEAPVYRESLIPPLIVGMLGALAYHAIYMFALRFLAGIPVSWSAAFWYATLPSILFDVILIVPVLRLLAPWHDRLHPRGLRL